MLRNMVKFNYYNTIAQDDEIMQGYKGLLSMVQHFHNSFVSYTIYKIQGQIFNLTSKSDIKMEEDEDKEELPDLPDKCPICDKQSKNLLLHIKKKESCNSKIDPKLYEYWKDEQNRYSKRKYHLH